MCAAVSCYGHFCHVPQLPSPHWRPSRGRAAVTGLGCDGAGFAEPQLGSACAGCQQHAHVCLLLQAGTERTLLPFCMWLQLVLSMAVSKELPEKFPSEAACV